MANTIGEQLKQAREKRGLTLEQAAEETHIRVHFLEALENDQRNVLPSMVQGRGFLRLYASLLDLPIAPLLAQWDGVIAPAGVEAPSIPHPVATAKSEAVAEAGKVHETLGYPQAAPAVDETTPTGPAQIYEVQAPTAGDDESSSAIFAEIGQKLRAQRESLGLSLAEVERYTRLRLRYIQALEAGQMDELPSPVQGRGMLSNYASFLNMDEQKLLLRFADGLQTRRIERQSKIENQGVFSQKRRPARQATIWRRILTPDLLFGIGVAIIILSFALWASARINVLRTQQEEPTPPGVGAVLLTPDAVTEIAENGATGTVTPAGTTVEGENSEAEGTPQPPADGEAVVGVPVLPSPPADTTPQETATLPPMNDDPLQVYIISRQRAYLKIVTDDKVRFLGRTVPGNAYAFSANKRIELSTGNSAALQVFFNQTDLGTLGIAGEVTNLVFTSEGMATPTASFTSTPTATRQATITPQPSATPTVTPTITPLIP